MSADEVGDGQKAGECAIEFSNETTDKETEGNTGQFGMYVAQILGDAVSRSLPKECELQQGSSEFKILASLIIRMLLYHSNLQVRMKRSNREWLGWSAPSSADPQLPGSCPGCNTHAGFISIGTDQG